MDARSRVTWRGDATAALLSEAAALLAASGGGALSGVLRLTRAAIGADDVVLRSADRTEVVAAATSAPGFPVPRGRDVWALDVPVRRTGELVGVLSVCAARHLSEYDAGVVTAIGNLVALTLAGDAAGPPWSAARAVLDDEADRAQVAATFDSVLDTLVSLRYAAELCAAGRADPAVLDEPVAAALVAFRAAYGDLRAHALDAGLRAALSALPRRFAGDRLHDGLSELRLSVDAADARLDALAPAVAVTAQRVAEAALRGATGQASVRAEVLGSRVKLRVDSAEIAYDASELSRWVRRASALGGDLRLGADGVELDLPVELGPRTEGRHDHGSDL